MKGTATQSRPPMPPACAPVADPCASRLHLRCGVRALRRVADPERLGVGVAVAAQPHPTLVGAVHESQGLLPVHSVAAEGKVPDLFAGDLVPAEPLLDGHDDLGLIRLYVLHVVQEAGDIVLDIDRDQLPVQEALVDESHRPEHLHPHHLAPGPCSRADLHDVQRAVVEHLPQQRVVIHRVLPGLRQEAMVPEDRPGVQLYVRGVSVQHGADGVQPLGRGDGVSPRCCLGDLDHHPLLRRRQLLRGVQRDVVPRRDGEQVEVVEK
mmetsp:Transcript_69845/g.195791  ORF Transcript_69845/g.195791 Transcript_69845/m.195791 type:complete len:265 (+) Transcript_69845:25-819(+)